MEKKGTLYALNALVVGVILLAKIKIIGFVMISANLQKAIKFVFLPALLLSVFLSISGTLFHFAQNILITKELGFVNIPTLKRFALFPQVIFALSLLIFSIYKPFEKIFRGTLITLIGMITLLTVTCPTSPLMYIALSLLGFNLHSLFLWGFINRLISLSEGIKYYIPFALILGIAGAVISNLGLITLSAFKWPLMTMLSLATALMLCSFFIFDWSWKRLPESLTHPESASSSSQTRFPFLSAAYLLTGCVMIKSFLDIIFKSQLKAQFSTPTAYANFMNFYSTFVSSSTTAIFVICAALGTWLTLKKGWKIAALYTSLAVLVGGTLFLSLSSSWLNQGVFTGLLTSTTSALFFPLIQILYLYIPYQKRFKTKIVTEMIALPLMKGIPLLTVQGLLVIFGSIAAITLYLKLLILILMVLLIIASKKAGPRFSDTKDGSLVGSQ